VILSEAGVDATEAFEDVGHSDEARALFAGMLVGDFDKNSSDIKLFKTESNAGTVETKSVVEQGSNIMYFVPLALLGAYLAWRFYSA